jgi:hypothetical protein
LFYSPIFLFDGAVTKFHCKANLVLLDPFLACKLKLAFEGRRTEPDGRHLADVISCWCYQPPEVRIKKLPFLTLTAQTSLLGFSKVGVARDLEITSNAHYLYSPTGGFRLVSISD